MVKIEFAEQDAVILVEILQSCLLDLKTERVATENRGFHAVLIQREQFVSGLIKQLEGTLQPI